MFLTSFQVTEFVLFFGYFKLAKKLATTIGKILSGNVKDWLSTVK